MSEQRKIINFTVAAVNEFAEQLQLSVREAFHYLLQYKGIAFLKENYDAEHLQSFDTIIDDLRILCRNNGGYL